MSEPVSLPVPALPPRYEPLRILGAGGGGEVWEMRDRVTGEHCAFKLLSGHAGEHELDALIREFLTLSALEGLCLPRVIRFGRLPQGEKPYVMRELIAGSSLDKVVEASPAHALEALAQVADQLTVLHRAGILHGDIKPANIICRDAGPATLVDFGLATHSSGQAQPHGLTPRYAAPELFAGRPLTARAEVYSLGLILREISGHLHLDDFSLAVIDALAEVVEQATAADPLERHPSSDEFAAALRSAAHMPQELHATLTTLAWPIVGIDATSAQLLARTMALPAGKSLNIEGVAGSGKTVLLRKLAWSLGVAGKPLAYVDADLRSDARAFEFELAQLAQRKESYLLVDDAAQLTTSEWQPIHKAVADAARLVSVGTAAKSSPDSTFQVPPLDRGVSTELLRRAVPSLTEEALNKILEVSQCRPKALRQWVTRIADGTLTNVDDVMQMQRTPPSLRPADMPVSMQAVQTLLDKGRFKDALPMLERLSTTGIQERDLAVARARLKLGLGEPQQAIQLLEPHIRDGIVPTPEVWLHWARACLGVGDYAAAIAASERATGHDTIHAEALIQRGLAECYLGQPDTARDAVTQALQLAEELGSKRVEATAHAALGFLAQRDNLLDAAFTHYNRAILVGQESADASLLANAELNLGGLLKMRGDIAAAIEHFEAAVDGGERAGRRATVRNALLNLANLDLFLGRLARARSRLEALTADGDALQPAQDAQRLGLEAELALRQGEPTEAEQLFSRSADAYEALGRDLDAAEARLESILAAVRVQNADPAQLRARIEALREKLGEASAHQALLQLAQGRVALRAGLEKDARHAIEQAEVAARACGHKEWLWRALEAHADLEQAAGGLLRARQFRETALALLEEMAASLPRDLRDVYWNDGRRRQLRAAVAQTQMPDPAALGFSVAAVNPTEITGSISTWLSNPIDRRLAKILEINAELATDLRLDRLIDRIIDHAIKLSGAELGLVLLHDADGHLSVQSSRTVGTDESHARFSTSIAETAITSGQPVVTLNAKDDQRMSGWASVHELRVQSVACVPIRAGQGPTIGALYLETRLRRGNRFQSELPMLQAFADQVAIALHGARLIKENQDRAEELKESNRKLQEAQQRLEELLGSRTQQLVRTRRQLQETRQTLYGHFGYHGLVGTSQAMRRVYALIERVKSADVAVLITGESGTGKEMVARAIHVASERNRGPFVGVNCGAIPENLLESELFGSARGAFTGADRDRLGLLREGEGGTVLLDEIGEMPSKMQAGLLRVLQSKTVRPVGGRREEHVDVRVICATHRNLEELVQAGVFREDLYYRIHVVELHLPALREHREDIPQLVSHFIGLFAAKFHQERKAVSRDALRLLMAQPWRGNIRELEHVLLNAWIMSDADELGPEDFELAVAARPETDEWLMVDAADFAPTGDSQRGRQLPPKSNARQRELRDVTATSRQRASDEKQRILEALRACDHNKVKAAKSLGIPRRTFYRRLEAYGIK